MRRPPEVGLVLLSLLVSLPGFSGCAGFSKNLSLSSPGPTGSDGVEAAAPSRLSWWRGSGSEASSSSEPATNLPETSRAASAPGGASPSWDVWEESRSEWLARHFPLLSRAWHGNASGNVRDGVDPSVGTQASRVSASSRATRDSSTSRADENIRPVKALSADDSASSGDKSVRGQSLRDEPPRLTTPSIIKARPHNLPESSGDVELDVSSAGPRGNEERSSDEPRPAQAAARQPEEGSPVPSPSEREAPELVSAPDQSGSVPRAESGDVLSPAEAGPVRLLAMAPYNGSAMWPVFNPDKEAQPQSSQAPAPASAVPPAAVAAPGQVPATATGQRLPAATPQSIYASPPPVSPPEPRRKLLSWLHPDRQAAPLASSQLPPALFPTTYRQASPCANPAQSTLPVDSAPCTTAPKVAKKPCVLTGLFVKLWSWGHGTSCGGCQNSGAPSCCHGCACCSGKNSTVSASPQGPATTLQGRATTLPVPVTSSAAPVRSRGTEPGDVAQGGNVVDSALSQGLDKSPQG